MKRNLQQTTGLGASTAMPSEAVGPANVRPEWIRLPKSGSLCPWSGLSRSKMNEIILPSRINGHRPPVLSISLRNRNQVKAVRLINFDSLSTYLLSLEEGRRVEFGDQQKAANSSFLTAPKSSGNQAENKTAGLNLR